MEMLTYRDSDGGSELGGAVYGARFCAGGEPGVCIHTALTDQPRVRAAECRVHALAALCPVSIVILD